MDHETFVALLLFGGFLWLLLAMVLVLCWSGLKRRLDTLGREMGAVWKRQESHCHWIRTVHDDLESHRRQAGDLKVVDAARTVGIEFGSGKTGPITKEQRDAVAVLELAVVNQSPS